MPKPEPCEECGGNCDLYIGQCLYTQPARNIAFALGVVAGYIAGYKKQVRNKSMHTRKEAYEHLESGGTIQYRFAKRTCQRTQTKYRDKRDEDSFWCQWRKAEYEFLKNPALSREDALTALETLELLPIPKKVRCTNKQEAIEHMKKGGLIQHQFGTCTFQNRIIGGIMECREVFNDGSFSSFSGNRSFLTEKSVADIDAVKRALQFYETLYLLPIEEDCSC